MNKPAARTILDFTLISNPVGPSNKARHAIRKAVRSVDRLPQTSFLTHYLAMTEGIAEEEILLGHGASHLLALLTRAERVQSILLPTPAPRVYEEMLKKAGVGIRPFMLDSSNGFKIDVEEFTERWRDVDAAMILNPHNPTGVGLPEELVAHLIQTAAEHDRLLILDETLRDFTGNPSPAKHVVAAPNAIMLRSFSTYHALAGLRLGYAIGHQALLPRLRHLLEPWPVNSLAPAAALASLRDKGYRKRTAQFLSTETEYARKKVGQLNGAAPIATPWGFLIRIQSSLAGLSDLLAQRGILVEHYSDAQDNHYLSFPFRSHAENARFLRTLRWILRQQSQREEGRSSATAD